MELTGEEKKIIDRINRSYDDNTQYVEASAKDWNCIVKLIRNQQKEIEELKEMKPLQDLIDTNIIIADYSHNYISKDKIRERLKHNEKQKNIVESVAKFEINNNGITSEGIEGLNDLIVYKSYEAVINELNYLLEEN